MAAALAVAMGMALSAPVAAQEGDDDDEQPETPDAENDGDGDGDDDAPEEPPPPTEEEIAQAREAYAKGAELFDAEDFEGAVTEFKKSYRLSRNPLLLYNIGYTLDEMGNKKLALFYFEKFLEDAPEDADKRREVKRSVRLLEREIELEEQAAKASADAEEDPPPEERKPVTEFMHKVVEEAPPGVPLDVTAFVPELADWQVTLFYRGAGKARYTSVSMRERYNELVGRIPPRVMKGSMVQYYIEAVDKQGNTVAQSGKSTSPHLVLVEEGAKPIYYPDLTGERDWDGAGTGVIGGGTGGTGGTGGAGRSDDEPRDLFLYLRWGSTATTAALFVMSASFLASAGNYSDTLEGEADASRTEDCPTGPPCRAFSNIQKDLQSTGKRRERVSRWTFGLGLVSAGVAGYFWYRELFGKKKADEDTGTAVAPVIDREYVGAAAQWRF